ncbi:MAG: sulfatase-like hydrolase/transferase [Bryobacteraceae bacterium]
MIQSNGHATPTPNLKKFATEVVVFRQAFDAAPTCSPSRAVLLTGTYPHSCGMLGLAHRGFSLKDPTRHLAHSLRSQGYLTVLARIQHNTQAEKEHEPGYERIVRPGPTAARRSHGPRRIFFCRGRKSRSFSPVDFSKRTGNFLRRIRWTTRGISCPGPR